MPAKKRFQSEALQAAYEEIIGDDPQRQADFEQELINVEAAQLLYDMRAKAGLSQRELQSGWGQRPQ